MWFKNLQLYRLPSPWNMDLAKLEERLAKRPFQHCGYQDLATRGFSSPDRFDVLDLPGRAEGLYWLDGLAADGAIDSALIFGTLKSCPSGLPETISAVWLENGVVPSVREAA